MDFKRDASNPYESTTAEGLLVWIISLFGSVWSNWEFKVHDASTSKMAGVKLMAKLSFVREFNDLALQ